MATISTMAIRILTQHGEAVAGVLATATAVAELTSRVVESSTAVRAANATSQAASRAYGDVAGEVAKFTGKLIGAATAAAAVSKAIRVGATDEMRESYERLTVAVEKAFKSFGEGFNRTAHLAKAMDQLSVSIRTQIGMIGTLGEALGTVVGWLTSWIPITVESIVAFKMLAVAIGIVAQVLITRLIVACVTYILTGKAMTTLEVLKIALKYAWATAMGVCTIACNVLTTAVIALETAGLPVWLAIAAVVLVVVGTIWVLHKAWTALTQDNAMTRKIQEIEEFQEKIKELDKDVNKMTGDLVKQYEQLGMTDKQKKLADFTTEANKGRHVGPDGKGPGRGDDLTDEMIAKYSMILDKIEQHKAAEEAAKKAIEAANEALKKRQELAAEAVKMQEDANKKLFQTGMTEDQKASDNFREKLEAAALLGPRVIAARVAQYETTLKQITAEENRLEIEKQIADLQKSAAQAGMTEAQKKMDDLKRMGADAMQQATAQAALKAKADAEEKVRLAERGKQLKESLATPADEYKKKINEIGKLLAAGAIDPITAMNAADAATKALEDANKAAGAGRDFASPAALLKGSAEAALAEDRQKTPFDRLTDLQRKQLAESQKLTGIAKQQLDAQIKGGVVVNIP